jgi:hypothetical protein
MEAEKAPVSPEETMARTRPGSASLRTTTDSPGAAGSLSSRRRLLFESSRLQFGRWSQFREKRVARIAQSQEVLALCRTR